MFDDRNNCQHLMNFFVILYRNKMDHLPTEFDIQKLYDDKMTYDIIKKTARDTGKLALQGLTL